MTSTIIDQGIEVAAPARRQSLYVLAHLLKRRTALAGLVIVLVVVLMAMFAPLVSPYDPLEQHIHDSFETPTLSHPLGTDNLGRDTLSRIIYGSRTSLQVGVFAIGLGAAVGVVLGMISGYFRGVIDVVAMRVMDALLALPGLLLTIAIATSLGTGLKALVIAVGIASTPHFARLLRGSVLVARELDYVYAAKAIGASDARIMFYHIWPNCLQPIVVQATLGIGVGILVGAGASFLGVGVQPPAADWGLMVSTGHQYVFNNWWLSVPPGLAIMFTVLGFNLLGDGLRDALDPRLRGVR
jgi:ABC-type dipeptide/oligopeptide/nickel transport system permease subunit